VPPSERVVDELLVGVRVLVVDDEDDARDLVETVLGEAGASVRTVASAQDARRAMALQRPDVLVSDIGMPDEDGYELMRRVRALGAEEGGDIPSVALTAFARAEDRKRATDAGFDRYLPKPVDPRELVHVVRLLANLAD
jgi:CheY-like chemotaxis protein